MGCKQAADLRFPLPVSPSVHQLLQNRIAQLKQLRHPLAACGLSTTLHNAGCHSLLHLLLCSAILASLSPFVPFPCPMP